MLLAFVYETYSVRDYGDYFRGGLVIALILKPRANWLHSIKLVLLVVHWQVACQVGADRTYQNRFANCHLTANS
jgi:hypothetical protein